MNKPAVKKLLAHLKRQQKTKAATRFNMRYFATPLTPDTREVLVPPACNTQACLGGEAVLAHKLGYIPKEGGITPYKRAVKKFGGDLEYIGAGALGLSDDERLNLFYFRAWAGEGQGWPKEYEAAYQAAMTPKARLKVAIDRVQHFLDTDGAE